jgi:exodeoxyribonuclease (lambda-induced)
VRIINCEQRSPEWFAARCGLITASRFKDARATLKSGAPAQARLDYMAELALERITGSLSDRFVTPAMQRGAELEGAARAAYEADTGEIVTEMGICLHDTLGFGYSPDGLVGADGLIEVKCPANPYKLAQLLLTRDVAEYVDQVQGGMWITGRAWCDVLIYHPNIPLRPLRVPRDAAYIDKMETDLLAFSIEVDAYTERLRKEAA